MLIIARVSTELDSAVIDKHIMTTSRTGFLTSALVLTIWDTLLWGPVLRTVGIWQHP